MKLSFVIPTRNRVQRLNATLRSIASQKSPPEEIIVVDASDDLTEVDNVLREFTGCFERFVRVVPERRHSEIKAL